MVEAMNERGREGPWRVPVTVQEIPATGRRFELNADEATRAAIAKSADLRALPRLEATFDVSKRGADGLHVVGRVSATVGQVCVVTLDPIENEVEEVVDLVFVPDAAPAAGDAPDREALKAATEEAPEPLLGDTVDLGAIATEFLILGIDLYPRKPDAVFQAPPIEDKTEHPFAALATLRRGQGGRDE
jgi:Large ribosomal RNA subunit accumulation protein YceD